MLVDVLKALHADQRDWSLPAPRPGTRGGMDAATELKRTYLQRVLRWWAGKGAAAKPPISRSTIDRP
ncbi:hypothetical protein FQJ88_15930 [Xanthomonas vasicola]|uniref:Integrase n=1 Tax=Xanthomonas vasicola TaxID=56459 RepID=A0ABD7S833_XANVA|nr:hypothetical protein NX81_006480 [Xanthomonas vasicola]TWQ29102.1 hypothetical protein FQJ97_17080 [Xanthomonas vasicola]TWQ38163.1 hypothetical protein FQJ96_12515 [Xanthomonas vasicola]TWQ51653.1 hypothetical protein FQK01_14675 [Xanthomonas vasicola]TWQ53875.1 hypothetical protein FQJ94_13585 [Xanthomonas vasicola]